MQNRAGLHEIVLGSASVMQRRRFFYSVDILNRDRLINLRLKTRGEQALFNLEIKKKSGSSINPNIHHTKVPSSGFQLRAL